VFKLHYNRVVELLFINIVNLSLSFSLF